MNSDNASLAMAEQLFVIGREMICECKNMVHTDYPDMESYHKDFEMRWKRALEMIEMAKTLVR